MASETAREFMSFGRLWQNYCAVKEDRDALNDGLAEIHRLTGRGDGHRSIKDTVACIISSIVTRGIDHGDELAELRSALTAERERAARAERERKEMEMRVIACGVAATHPDAELTARPPYADRWGSQQLLYVCELRAERDTLRQHNAVLRAECQAGRELTSAVGGLGGHNTDPLEAARGVEAAHGNYIANQYLDARKAQIATDAAGAMGDTEVRRG